MNDTETKLTKGSKTMNEEQKREQKESADKVRNMIINAEANGGSIAEIVNCVKMWDSAATSVDVDKSTGDISVNGSKLNDEELMAWILWTEGCCKNRQGK